MKRVLIIGVLAAAGLFAQIPTANTQIYNEVPTGAINGVNATFTLNYTPAIPASLTMFRNGMRQALGTDYNISGNSITFLPVSIPGPGDLLIVDYVTGSTANLLTANNLSDLSNAGTARTNLGLGSAATQNKTAFDAAGAAAAMLTQNNSWTGTQTFTAPIAQATAASSAGTVNYLHTNAANQGSTTLLNPGIVFYDDGNHTWGTDLGYNAPAGRYRTRLFAHSIGDIALSIISGTPSGQSSFSDYLIVRGDTGHVLVGATADNGTDKLQVNGSLTASGVKSTGALTTNVRTVSTTDTATTSDHTIILSGTSPTETLPASPLTGQDLFIVNAAATSASISGNSKSIWAAGISSGSMSLAANATTILQFDGTLWRQIK